MEILDLAKPLGMRMLNKWLQTQKDKYQNRQKLASHLKTLPKDSITCHYFLNKHLNWS